MQVNILQHLELACLLLQLIQALRLIALVLDQLLLLASLAFHIVLEALDDLLLRRDFVLGPFKLLLEDLLALLSFSKLFPKHRIAAQLLLQVVNLVVMLLLFDSFFQFLQESRLSLEVLQLQDFVTCLAFGLFQAFHLFENDLVVVLISIVSSCAGTSMSPYSESYYNSLADVAL